jgi:hypothetical protein
MAAKQKWRGDDRSFRGMRVSDSSLLTYVDDLRTCCSELANVRDGLSSGAVTPRFIPELIVAPFADASYAENKRYQVQLAGELWRVRRRIRALDEVCEEPPAPLPAPAPAIINWFTSTTLAVSRDLPPPWEQRAVVREMALRAAVEALQATGASSAQGEARAPRDEADLTVLLSEEYSRAYDGGGATTVHGFTPVFTGIAPDDATYTCWLVVTQHALSRRIAAVLVALRKRRPPHLESLERLAFACIGSHVPLGASAETAEGMRLRVAVLEAFEAWRAPSTPPEPRRLLVARCESLAWPFELCKAALPLRPSCHAVLVQAGDAVVELAVAALLADSAPLRAHVGEALGRLHEALARAAALHAHDGANVGELEPLTWRHRLSTRLAFELSQRAELLALPMPAPLPLGEAARKLGSAAKQLIDGFGGAGRRAKAAVVVAVEAFCGGVLWYGGGGNDGDEGDEGDEGGGGGGGGRVSCGVGVRISVRISVERPRRRGRMGRRATHLAPPACAHALQRRRAACPRCPTGLPAAPHPIDRLLSRARLAAAECRQPCRRRHHQWRRWHD